jgi:hypothetical protein
LKCSRRRHGHDTGGGSVTRFDDGVIVEEGLAVGLLLRSDPSEVESVIFQVGI